MNIIYHYYPRFREKIFESIACQQPSAVFIYGRNAGLVSHQSQTKMIIPKELHFRNLIFQSFGIETIRLILSSDSIILGDLKFINTWIYAILGRLFGRRILWTHGLLAPESD